MHSTLFQLWLILMYFISKVELICTEITPSVITEIDNIAHGPYTFIGLQFIAMSSPVLLYCETLFHTVSILI